MKKSNKYDQAYAEVSGFGFADKKQEREILKMVRQEIDEKDAVRNHVLLLSKTNDSKAKVYQTKAVYQMFGNRALEKMESNFRILGYDRMVIIHKAEKPSAKKSVQLSEQDKKIEELMKEIQQLKAGPGTQAVNLPLYNNLSATDSNITVNGTTQTVNSGTESTDTQKEKSVDEKEDELPEDKELLNSIKAMKVADLRDFAEQNVIDLGGKTTKDDIVDIIYKHQLQKNSNK